LLGPGYACTSTWRTGQQRAEEAMGRWRGTPIPRPAAAAVPGRRRRLRQPWRGGGGEGSAG
jgi:hypothetical protein